MNDLSNLHRHAPLDLARRQWGRRSFLAAASLACAGLSRPRSLRADQIKQPGKTPNTPFAVNVEMWFGRRSFLDKIRMAAEMGFPAIEFWPYENKPIDEAAQLLKSLHVETAQFTAWGFGTELNNPSFDHSKFERKIQESCDVADRLNCKLFTVVVGNDIPGISKKDMHAAAIRGLKRARRNK